MAVLDFHAEAHLYTNIFSAERGVESLTGSALSGRTAQADITGRSVGFSAGAAGQFVRRSARLSASVGAAALLVIAGRCRAGLSASVGAIALLIIAGRRRAGLSASVSAAASLIIAGRCSAGLGASVITGARLISCVGRAECPSIAIITGARLISCVGRAKCPSIAVITVARLISCVGRAKCPSIGEASTTYSGFTLARCSVNSNGMRVFGDHSRPPVSLCAVWIARCRRCALFIG